MNHKVLFCILTIYSCSMFASEHPYTLYTEAEIRETLYTEAEIREKLYTLEKDYWGKCRTKTLMKPLVQFHRLLSRVMTSIKTETVNFLPPDEHLQSKKLTGIPCKNDLVAFNGSMIIYQLIYSDKQSECKNDAQELLRIVDELYKEIREIEAPTQDANLSCIGDYKLAYEETPRTDTTKNEREEKTRKTRTYTITNEREGYGMILINRYPTDLQFKINVRDSFAGSPLEIFNQWRKFSEIQENEADHFDQYLKDLYENYRKQIKAVTKPTLLIRALTTFNELISDEIKRISNASSQNNNHDYALIMGNKELQAKGLQGILNKKNNQFLTFNPHNVICNIEESTAKLLWNTLTELYKTIGNKTETIAGDYILGYDGQKGFTLTHNLEGEAYQINVSRNVGTIGQPKSIRCALGIDQTHDPHETWSRTDYKDILTIVTNLVSSGKIVSLDVNNKIFSS